MKLQAEKLRLIEWVAQLEDSSIIDQLTKVYNEAISKEDWWDKVPEEHKESIARGKKDIEEGRTYTNEEARKVYEKHLYLGSKR